MYNNRYYIIGMLHWFPSHPCPRWGTLWKHISSELHLLFIWKIWLRPLCARLSQNTDKDGSGSHNLQPTWQMKDEYKEACIEKRKCSAYQKLSQCSDCWRGYTSPDAHFASGFTESTGKCHIFPQGDFLNYAWDASISHETLQIQWHKLLISF